MPPIRDLTGAEKPEHICSPRSPLAQATAHIVQLVDGPRIAWNLLLSSLDPEEGGSRLVGIRYCPFCGVDLFLGVVPVRN